MNRREFTKGLVALGAAPMVPMPALSAPAAAAPQAVTGNFTPYMFSWAVHHARMAGQCSSAILSQHLGVQAEVAQALTSRLIKKGVIGAPNALGVSRALNPFQSAVESAPVKHWKYSDPVHDEFVEQSRLQEQLRKMASEEDGDSSVRADPVESAEPDESGDEIFDDAGTAFEHDEEDGEERGDSEVADDHR